MKTPHLRVFAVLASLIGLTVATPCLARNEAAYSSSMPHTYKKAYAIWRAHLPQRYRHIGWAARFNGYALPIREVTLLGQPMLFFESCKPHACTIDEADALVSPDGDKVFGVIHQDGRPIRVGKSSDAQIACLRAFADSYVQSTC